MGKLLYVAYMFAVRRVKEINDQGLLIILVFASVKNKLQIFCNQYIIASIGKNPSVTSFRYRLMNRSRCSQMQGRGKRLTMHGTLQSEANILKKLNQ